MILFIGRILTKNGTNELKTEIESQCRKQTQGYQWVSGERIWEMGMDTYTLLYVKQMTHKSLHRKSAQCSVMDYMGKESEKCAYVYMITDSLCSTTETNTNCKSIILQ